MYVTLQTSILQQIKVDSKTKLQTFFKNLTIEAHRKEICRSEWTNLRYIKPHLSEAAKFLQYFFSYSKFSLTDRVLAICHLILRKEFPLQGIIPKSAYLACSCLFNGLYRNVKNLNVLWVILTLAVRSVGSKEKRASKGKGGCRSLYK